ncbi:MAG TPA: murein L,D-transpeptidase catalytic domain family protein [Puia sp.]|nr:murein L,D-transpeptidase catalytic domain family protein [Puia sp.]
MRLLTNLVFKVSVSGMVLTAPAMINGHPNTGGTLPDREAELPYASSAVIKTYIDHLKIWPVRAYVDRKSMVMSFPYVIGATVVEKKEMAVPVVEMKEVGTTVAAPVTEAKVVVMKPVAAADAKVANAPMMPARSAKTAELRRVMNESDYIYRSMGLGKVGLSETAFEFAWRGYHNLLKKRIIRKRSVLSIADFSQSSSEKRMYVIDIRHRRLLYRTYVAHGQNSGAEYADSFSNEPESFKSSLGFYVTRTTYVGKNGLSLRLNGVDNGYNDMALKRNIVLHGCSYVGDEYLENFGATGTSLGCPALPATVSAQIIHAVKGGSCFFIYHPTPEYLDHSVVINE